MRDKTELIHYGVKGMRWGRRKEESRSEYRARTKQEKNDYYQKRVDHVMDQALKKGDKVLIKTRFQGDTAQTIATGKEMIDFLSKGVAFDAKMTDVFATYDKKHNAYVQNDPYGVYKKSKRR